MSTKMMGSFVELGEAAQRLLIASPYPDVRTVKVDVTPDGKIALHGSVNCFFHKQLAQETIRELALSYETRVANHLTVSGEFGSE